nr:hypothetical protein [Tanacetum cinerariifolium]
MIGWNTNVAKCMVLPATHQAMLCLVEAISSNNPMVIMGDMNVSLNFEDHYEGMSCITQDMEEFQDCVNALKMEDICCTGFHFTWTKSLLNPVADILKKINRVMGSEKFMEIHNKAHAVFLPYGISDHCPAVLTCAQLLKAKPKSFRFANYITDKEEFSQAMKPVMNKLNWKNGDLFEEVRNLKRSLDDLQRDIDNDPHNAQLRSSGVQLLQEYSVAIDDEEKLLIGILLSSTKSLGVE